jgi:hypothetical protein
MELADNSEALAFGKRVIRDMMHRDLKHYAGWTMDIAHDGGVAIAVRFDTVEPDK